MLILFLKFLVFFECFFGVFGGFEVFLLEFF